MSSTQLDQATCHTPEQLEKNLKNELMSLPWLSASVIVFDNGLAEVQSLHKKKKVLPVVGRQNGVSGLVLCAFAAVPLLGEALPHLRWYTRHWL